MVVVGAFKKGGGGGVTYCEVGTCNKVADYWIRWEHNGVRREGVVCMEHDRYLGRENLLRWRPWLGQEEVVKWDKEFCKHPDAKWLSKYMDNADMGGVG